MCPFLVHVVSEFDQGLHWLFLPFPFWFCSAELFYDRGNHHEFTSVVKELAGPGELAKNCVYPFEFLHVEKPHESYTGANVQLRSVALAAACCVL